MRNGGQTPHGFAVIDDYCGREGAYGVTIHRRWSARAWQVSPCRRQRAVGYPRQTERAGHDARKAREPRLSVFHNDHTEAVAVGAGNGAESRCAPHVKVARPPHETFGRRDGAGERHAYHLPTLFVVFEASESKAESNAESLTCSHVMFCRRSRRAHTDMPRTAMPHTAMPRAWPGANRSSIDAKPPSRPISNSLFWTPVLDSHFGLLFRTRPMSTLTRLRESVELKFIPHIDWDAWRTHGPHIYAPSIPIHTWYTPRRCFQRRSSSRP